MALIGKIQKRSGLLLIVVAGGLVLFLIQGALDSMSQSSGADLNTLGEINGEPVSREAYNRELQKQESAFMLQSQGQAPQDYQRQQFENQAWEKMVFELAYKEQFDELGITLTTGDEDSEEVDMVQGTTVHKSVKDQFKNEAGQFDVNRVKKFLKDLPNLPEDNNQREMAKFQWGQFKDYIFQDRLRSKYLDLFEKTNYVTKAQAERSYFAKNSKATFDYLYLPFSSIPDSTIEITDAQLSEFLVDHKKEFKVEEGRSVSYTAFSIRPTKRDSAATLEIISNLKQDLINSDKDSLLIGSRAEGSNPIQEFKQNELPGQLARFSGELVQDSVMGPFLEGMTYKLYELLGYRTDTSYSDSVSASHILIKTDQANPSDPAKLAQAQKVLDLALSGENFAFLAAQYSEGPTKTKGGDLGTFGKGAMVPAFEQACWSVRESGVIPRIVTSQFGHHIINVTQPAGVEGVNELAIIGTIDRAITAGEETQDSVYTAAAAFLAECENADQMKEKAEANDLLIFNEVPRITPTQKNISGLKNVRHIIQWSYEEDTEIGQVYDRVEMFEEQAVIFALTNKSTKGEVNIEDVRPQLEKKYRDHIKGNDLITIINGTDGYLAERAKGINEEKGDGFAISETVTDASLANNRFGKVGNEPKMVGTAFGLKPDTWSATLVGDQGVYIVQLKEITNAEEPEGADYSAEQKILQGSASGRQSSAVDRAIKEMASIKDQRYKI